MSGATEVLLKGSGAYSRVEGQIDPTHQALRVSIRPSDTGMFGSYSQAFTSGVMAAALAANSPIWTFRWTSTTVWALVRKVRLTADTDATAFAQGSTVFQLFRATAFTAQDTGGANVVFAGKTGVRSSRMPASQINYASSATGNFAVAGTATLTAGTRTLDSNPMHTLIGGAGASPAIALVPPPGLLVDPLETGRQPIELQNNEGLVLQATVPATGTWKFAVEVDWDEVDPERYFGLYT